MLGRRAKNEEGGVWAEERERKGERGRKNVWGLGMD